MQEAGPLALDKEILDDFLPFSRGRSSLMKNTGIVVSRAKHPIARVFLTGVSINLYNMYNNSNEFVMEVIQISITISKSTQQLDIAWILGISNMQTNFN